MVIVIVVEVVVVGEKYSGDSTPPSRSPAPMTQWLRLADNSSSFSHSNCCTTGLEMSNTSDVFLLLLTIHPLRKMLSARKKNEALSILPGVSARFSIYHPIVCKA